MTLKRINPLLVEPRYYRGCDCGLVARKAVAQAQLEADLKPYKKLQEKIQVTNVYYLREIQNIREAHNAMIREIFEEIELKHQLGNAKWIDGRNWQALKQKYIGGGKTVIMRTVGGRVTEIIEQGGK